MMQLKLFTRSTLMALMTTVSLACTQHPFSWLEGEWKRSDVSIYEDWSKEPASGILSGSSYSVNAGDTLVLEVLRLVENDGDYFYIADIAGEQGPVPFKITEHTSQYFQAENPDHDFPKKITYHYYKKENRMEVVISGDGKSITFPFVRYR